MKFTTYSESYLKGLKKDELIALYRQLEDNLKSEIAEKEMTETCIRAANIKVTEQHKKDLIKAGKDAVEEFVNFIKEQMPLDICSGMEACEEINSLYELFLFKNLKANRLKTNADKIRSLSDEELADFINTIASESMATISYGTQERNETTSFRNGMEKEYTEVWEDKKETIKWLQKTQEEKTVNKDTYNYERN